MNLEENNCTNILYEDTGEKVMFGVVIRLNLLRSFFVVFTEYERQDRR